MIKFKMHPSGCAIVEFKTSDGEAHQVEADICQQVFMGAVFMPAS